MKCRRKVCYRRKPKARGLPCYEHFYLKIRRKMSRSSAQIVDRCAGFELDMGLHGIGKRNLSLCSAAERTYIILADFKLPGFDGFAALLWSMEICPTVTFYLCLRHNWRGNCRRASETGGAVDYVLKDRLARLPSAIHRALGEVKEKEDRREAETALSESEEKFRTPLREFPGRHHDHGASFLEVYFWKPGSP